MGVREKYSALTKGVLYNFPWENMGIWKYLAYVIVLGVALIWEGAPWRTNISLNLLFLAAMRYTVYQFWGSANRLPFLYRPYIIQKKGIPFEQVDHEAAWENAVIFTTLLASAFKVMFPALFSLPFWDAKGILVALLLHVGPVEWLYYWGHRALHHHYLYARYHSHHHSSFVTQPITSINHPMLEIIFYTLLFAIPITGAVFMGCGSIVMYHLYVFFVDTLNAWGHCNFEFIPTGVFEALPFLKYLVYSPTFHSLHHSKVHTNFALFMPLYDYMYGTADPTSDQLHRQIREGNHDKVDCVYLTHATDILSVFHQSFGFQTFAAQPYSKKWYMWLTWPAGFLIMVASWLFAKPFTATTHLIGKNFELQTWIIPRYNFQYRMKPECEKIKRFIEQCIQDAQEAGSKVIALGLLNKDLLDGDFLRTKSIEIPIVTGETLTAAIIVKKIEAQKVDRVFLASASSRVGQAIATYLCQHGVTVVALLPTKSCFQELQGHVGTESQKNLVFATNYKNGKDCKVWIVDDMVRKDEQKWAPPGTCFHHFGVFPLSSASRSDCTYEHIPAMRLPSIAKTINVCEDILPRYVVRAAYAAGILHALEGWKHNDFSNEITTFLIDNTWEAASKHGFSVYSLADESTVNKSSG